MEGILPYSKSSDVNVNLIQNTLIETSRVTFDRMSGHLAPAKLTYTIKHHTGPVLDRMNH